MDFDFSTIAFPAKLSVTEQEIDISVLNEKQKQFYIDLFKELISLYTAAQKPRFILAIAGPSGAGKSVIGTLFKEIAKQVTLPFNFESITIDAFHYPNAVLNTTFTDGGEPLKNYKGRYDTYDTAKLKKMLTDFSNGESVSFPNYSRKLHEPIENVFTITNPKTVLLIEGLWLLYDHNGWDAIYSLLDFSIFVSVDEDKTKELTIKRHIQGGRTTENAEQYYQNVDKLNFDLVEKTKGRADKIIPPYYEI